jgi:hypothetical protein
LKSQYTPGGNARKFRPRLADRPYRIHAEIPPAPLGMHPLRRTPYLDHARKFRPRLARPSLISPPKQRPTLLGMHPLNYARKLGPSSPISFNSRLNSAYIIRYPPTANPANLPICLPARLSVSQSACPSACLPVRLPPRPPVCLSVYLFICLSVCLSIYCDGVDTSTLCMQPTLMIACFWLLFTVDDCCGSTPRIARLETDAYP